MSLPTPNDLVPRDVKKIGRSTHGRTKKSEQKSTTPVMFLRAGWQIEDAVGDSKPNSCRLS